MARVKESLLSMAKEPANSQTAMGRLSDSYELICFAPVWKKKVLKLNQITLKKGESISTRPPLGQFLNNFPVESLSTKDRIRAYIVCFFSFIMQSVKNIRSFKFDLWLPVLLISRRRRFNPMFFYPKTHFTPPPPPLRQL